MLIHVHVLRRLHEVTNFVHAEVPPGLALLKLENLKAEESLGENLEVMLKGLVEDYFRGFISILFCLIGDLPRS